METNVTANVSWFPRAIFIRNNVTNWSLSPDPHTLLCCVAHHRAARHPRRTCGGKKCLDTHRAIVAKCGVVTVRTTAEISFRTRSSRWLHRRSQTPWSTTSSAALLLVSGCQSSEPALPQRWSRSPDIPWQGNGRARDHHWSLPPDERQKYPAFHFAPLRAESSPERRLRQQSVSHAVVSSANALDAIVVT